MTNDGNLIFRIPIGTTGILLVATVATLVHAQNASPQRGPIQSEESQAVLPPGALWRINTQPNDRETNGIYRIRFSDDGQKIAIRNRQNVVQIFDASSHNKVCEFKGHENNWITSIDFSPDGRFVVTAAGSSETVKIWRAEDGKLQKEIDADVSMARFTNDGQRIRLLTSENVETFSWPAAEEIEQQLWNPGNHRRGVLSDDGNLVVRYRPVTKQIYQIQLLDLRSKAIISLGDPQGLPKTVTVSPNQLMLAAVYQRDSKISVWDLREPDKSRFVLNGHREPVQSVSFSADNRFLVSSGWDKKAVVWDLLSRQAIGELAGHTEHVNAAAFSPLNFTVATGASGKTDTSAILWDFRTLLLTGDALNRQRRTFKQIWNGMGASSVRTSLSATSQLVDRHQEYMAELIPRVENGTLKSLSRNIDGFIRQLEDPDFSVRQQAIEKLAVLRGQAEPELLAARKASQSAEVRYRIGKILKRPRQRPKKNFTDGRRWHRIVLALELIGNDQAKKVLDRIANGHVDIDISRTAQESVERIDLRAKTKAASKDSRLK